MKKTPAGFTLIELMVGLLLSMFLMLGVSSYFAQSRATFDYQRAQAGQLQSERFASFVVGNMVRHAGFAPLNDNRIQGLGLQFPAAGIFSAAQIVSAVDGTHLVTVLGETVPQTYPNDTLSVRYVGELGMNRCSGAPATPDTLHVDSLSADGIYLRCDTGTEQARLLGADDLQVSLQTRVLGLDVVFGEDLDDNNSADTYVDASDVTNWNNVLTAQVELFIQSGTQTPQSVRTQLVFENVIGTDQL